MRYNTKVVGSQNMSFFGKVAVSKIFENSCKVEIQLLVPGSVHVKAPKSPGDFFVDCLLILEHILLKNLRD